jgi:hypothetical protein
MRKKENDFMDNQGGSGKGGENKKCLKVVRGVVSTVA